MEHVVMLGNQKVGPEVQEIIGEIRKRILGNRRESWGEGF